MKRLGPIAPLPAGLAALATAFACGGPDDGAGEGEAPSVVRPALGEPFELPIGAEAVVGSGDLTVVFRELVEESRCPEGVRCPTAGNAAARFGVEAAGGARATVTLATDRGSAEVAVVGHRLRLVDLAPRPNAGTPIDTSAYVASLVATAAGAER